MANAKQLTPYFLFATLVHLVGIASRFDLIAMRLPQSVSVAIMLAQVPLLLLSAFFEGTLTYDTPENFPSWMRINSRPVKWAFTFGFVYFVVVVAQTWDISLGPVDPTPPASFPPMQRALWFTMFTVGMSFPFYLTAAAVVIPALRWLTHPLRRLPTVLGALVAIVIGAAAGVGILAAMQSHTVGDTIANIQTTIRNDPALAFAVTAAAILLPLAIGLIRSRKD